MDSFTLYVDQPITFTCAVTLDGVSARHASARLIADCDTANLVFYGTLDNGTCVIPVPDVGSLLPEGATGQVRLEIVADGSLFAPWDAPFIVACGKSASVTSVAVCEPEPVVPESTPVNEPVNTSVTDIPAVRDEPVTPIAAPPTRKATVSNPMSTEALTETLVRAFSKRK